MDRPAHITRPYAWVTALILLMAGVELALGAIALHYVKDSLIASTGESLALAAADIADKLDRTLYERYYDIQVIAQAPVLQGRDTAAKYEFLRAIKNAFGGYLRFIVTDATGRIVASTNPSLVGEDRKGSDWFQAMREGNNVHVGDVQGSKDSTEALAVSFTAPIKNPKGEFLGAVRTVVGLSILEGVFAETSRVFKAQRGPLVGKIEWQLLTRDGDIISDSILRQEGKTINLKRLGLPSALLAGSAQPGYVEEKHLRRSVEVVTGYAHTRGYGDFTGLHWGVLVHVDRSDILDPINKILWKLGGTAALMVLPILGFLLWTTGRLRSEWAQAQEETARAQAAETTLRESEERYRTVTETATDSIIGFDEDSRIIFANSATEKIFGYALAEMVDQRLTMLIPEHQQQIHKVLPMRSLETDKKPFAGDTLEIIGLHKSGKAIPLEISLGEHSKHGKRIFTCIVRDVTERKQVREVLRQTEEQLRQSQKMEAVGQLAGGIAHDFNNLLAVILGFCDLLLIHLPLGDSGRNYAEEVRKAADRAAMLTHQLLAFSRRQMLATKVLNLNAVVTNLEPMLRRLIVEYIELEIVQDLALGQVRADPGQIEQIILNLVVNARDAMPQGGKLTIETANVELDKPFASQHISVQPGPYIMLAVSDTGCGMDSETQGHVFEPFFTTKEQGKGTGLGLSTVYGVVKQSGGHIFLYSEPGRGATFQIFLPRVEEAVETVQPEVVRTRLPLGTETVLLVEDDEGVREMVRTVLEQRGYTVLVACHSKEAFQISGQYDGVIRLMITDVVMPGMNGRELAERLASSRPEMKVLFMSGYTEDTMVRHEVLEATTAFLQKPFTPDTLSHKVRELLDESM